MISQTSAATPPLLSVKVAYRNPKTGLTRGHRGKKLALKPIALYRALHEIVLPIAPEWDTKILVLKKEGNSRSRVRVFWVLSAACPLPNNPSLDEMLGDASCPGDYHS